jgi:hypothetical protein
MLSIPRPVFSLLQIARSPRISPLYSVICVIPLQPPCYSRIRKLRGHEALHWGGTELPEAVNAVRRQLIAWRRRENRSNRFDKRCCGVRIAVIAVPLDFREDKSKTRASHGAANKRSRPSVRFSSIHLAAGTHGESPRAPAARDAHTTIVSVRPTQVSREQRPSGLG